MFVDADTHVTGAVVLAAVNAMRALGAPDPPSITIPAFENSELHPLRLDIPGNPTDAAGLMLSFVNDATAKSVTIGNQSPQSGPSDARRECPCERTGTRRLTHDVSRPS